MISMRKFYKIASWLMVIVVVANTWNLLKTWDITNLPTKISLIAGSILFNVLLVALFIGLYRMTPDMEIQNKEIAGLLEQYKEK